MPGSNLTSVVVVLPVADHSTAVNWYERWVGRAPDVVPTDGVAEWQLAENAWIQVSADSQTAGRTTVVMGVKDLVAQRTACAAVDVTVGEINDYGFIKSAEAVDPEGNKIVFVQEVSEG